jgi:hypothetical protein
MASSGSANRSRHIVAPRQFASGHKNSSKIRRQRRESVDSRAAIGQQASMRRWQFGESISQIDRDADLLLNISILPRGGDHRLISRQSEALR